MRGLLWVEVHVPVINDLLTTRFCFSRHRNSEHGKLNQIWYATTAAESRKVPDFPCRYARHVVSNRQKGTRLPIQTLSLYWCTDYCLIVWFAVFSFVTVYGKLFFSHCRKQYFKACHKRHCKHALFLLWELAKESVTRSFRFLAKLLANLRNPRLSDSYIKKCV